MNETRKAMIAATVAYCIFGLSYLFSNQALDVVKDPIILLSIRFTITFIAPYEHFHRVYRHGFLHKSHIYGDTGCGHAA